MTGALLVLLISVVVDVIGYGIVIPLLPLYIQQQGAGGTLVGLFSSLYALTQALAGPMLGGLSDRIGRKPVLLGCLAGTGLSYLLLGLADSLEMLVLALLLDSLTGGNMSIAQAYVADRAAPAERTRAFGLLNVAFGVGLMVGPVIGGTLSTFGLGVPALVAAGLAGANLLFGVLRLPESLPPERRQATPLVALNPISQLIGAWQYAGVRRWLLVVLLVNLSFVGLQSNVPLFSGARFGWNAATNAYFFAFVGLCAVLTQALLLGPLRDRFGEYRLVVGGASLMAVHLALMAAVPAGWMLFPVVALVALGSNLAIPSLSGLIAAQGDLAGQGRVMGAMQVCVNAALVAGPLIAGVAFDLIGIGAPYVIGGVIAGMAAMIAAGRPRSDGE